MYFLCWTIANIELQQKNLIYIFLCYYRVNEISYSEKPYNETL